MRVVRTCDFCGDDATGLYEPLPSSIPDGPRLLLCDDCRDRLASVVDPLVGRIEGGEPAQRPDGSADSGDGTGEPAGQAPSAAGEGRDRQADSPGAADAPPNHPSESADASSSVASDPEAEPSVSESRDASGRAQPDRAGTPHGYRKVMRFLENRELPVDRGEAVQLAADAYELADAEVERCIDHAVQYGRLRQVDGELKR